MTYIEELRDVVQRLHGAKALHVGSVPVKETFQGKTVWEGVVEIFDLVEHSGAKRLYAWTHEPDGPERPKRHVTVLHTDAITSPLLAVRAFIVQEFREGNLEPAES